LEASDTSARARTRRNSRKRASNEKLGREEERTRLDLDELEKPPEILCEKASDVFGEYENRPYVCKRPDTRRGGLMKASDPMKCRDFYLAITARPHSTRAMLKILGIKPR
jgi:hypothetical protein